MIDIPLTRYTVSQLKKYTIIAAGLFTAVFLFGNILAAIFCDSVTVSEKDYTLKEGFPLFHSQQAYLKFIKSYPYNPGIALRFHTVREGQSLWDIRKAYNVSIDTIIAANPYMTRLDATPGTELVIPAKDGVLFTFDDLTDVWDMTERLSYKGDPSGEYGPSFFKIFSTDDIRLVFYEKKQPLVVNDKIERLYSLKKIFKNPVKNGFYTSLFGNRIDPFIHIIAFHNGIDIQSRYGTPIYPARDGIVIFTGWRDGYGKTIMVQHHEGYMTLYGHCSRIAVKKGDWVKTDTIIGHVGSTGRSTGPHLHLTVMRHGREINPLRLIW